MDAYFTGVYRQSQYIAELGDYENTYIKAVNCIEAFAGATNLTSYVESTLPYLKCPSTTDLVLRGTHALDKTPMETNST
jgi:hypothetical protein